MSGVCVVGAVSDVNDALAAMRGFQKKFQIPNSKFQNDCGTMRATHLDEESSSGIIFNQMLLYCVYRTAWRNLVRYGSQHTEANIRATTFQG